MIRKLKADGITLEEVAEELNYRHNANDLKWMITCLNTAQKNLN